MQDAVAGRIKHVLCFVQLDFGSESLRVTNAAHDVDWDGFTWRGVAHLGAVESVEEATGTGAKALKFGISGVQNNHISLALNEEFRGRPAKLWLGVVEPGSGIVADPVLIFVGRMSEMAINRGTTASIAITAESAMAAWARPNTRRYSDADQQGEFPGDLGFQYMSELVSGLETIWGTT